MKATKHRQSIAESGTESSVTLGDYAQAIIQEQYRHVVKQEKKVLADQNPEHLHHMRVSTRRLRTALHVFDRAIALPKAATAKRIGSLAKVLGKLRDLDVQIADLQNRYHPAVSPTEQRSLDDVINKLQRQRRAAFSDVEDALTRSRYRDLKEAYEDWFDRPRYTPIANQPLVPLLPDLLTPLLSTLLLHPGWLVSIDEANAANEVLHDLRKACKHVRYQAEFFVSFYSDAFKVWVEDVKTTQTRLGTLHDSQVLLELLADHLPKHVKLPDLHAEIDQTHTEAMSNWETIRQQYAEPAFRYHLHHLLLEPIAANAATAKRLYA